MKCPEEKGCRGKSLHLGKKKKSKKNFSAAPVWDLSVAHAGRAGGCPCEGVKSIRETPFRAPLFLLITSCNFVHFVRGPRF
ncbi:hypothetical protein CEXT_74881 [Caerostris extrusa]|uniref:Uncharacterized protein n=1 Tax=Caerostris extrusa TaxID=172846 RepID=A0AAV4S8S7_CAEEX|nr:hypothetical protein CEXT_74881 [Caerostris extrusa]